MSNTRRSFLMSTAAAFAWAGAPRAFADAPAFTIAAPMDPPEWALLERELLDANTRACVQFFHRYFNQATGYLEETARWGGDDGPDDAPENMNDWPHIYQLGGGDIIKTLVNKGYEGHVRQYTEAKTTDVPFAKEGMYYKEFPVMMDWQHNAEGLSVFNLMGLMDPYNPRWRDRVRRFAGFYDGSDPGAPNYDPKFKIIKSMINGSRGPLLRKATALDWTGDPIDVANRFPSLGHGEADYKMMLAHFQEYTDVVGDHPLNLSSTELALNAFMLSHEQHYKDWLLIYVDAWVERAKQNNDILPSNVGLDGTIGGAADGKWYGGAYGWNFSPVVPQTGKREDRNRVVLACVAFFTAYLISGGDDKYLAVWRRQADRINAQAKTIDGKLSTPRMFGDQGWYSYHPGKYEVGALEIYYLSMKPEDRKRAPDNPWYDFLDGKNPAFPVTALRRDLARIRRQMEIVRADTTSPDMRLADSALDSEPASTTSLIELMEGRHPHGPSHLGARNARHRRRAAACAAALFRSRAAAPRHSPRCRGADRGHDGGRPHRYLRQCEFHRLSQHDRAGRRLWRAPDRLGVGRQTHPARRCRLFPGAAGPGRGRAADDQDETLRQCAKLGPALEGDGALQRRRAADQRKG